MVKAPSGGRLWEVHVALKYGLHFVSHNSSNFLPTIGSLVGLLVAQICWWGNFIKFEIPVLT